MLINSLKHKMHVLYGMMLEAHPRPIICRYREQPDHCMSMVQSYSSQDVTDRANHTTHFSLVATFN